MTETKKAVSLIIVLICAITTVLSAGCSVKPTGNLFDKKTLKRYEIPWLEKPQNVTNENQYISGKDYVYECEFETDEEIHDYVSKMFNTFLEKKYTVAYYLARTSTGDLFTTVFYDEVKVSDNLADFYIEGGEQYIPLHAYRYMIHYSTKTIDEMKQVNSGNHMGYDMGANCICIWACYKTEDGKIPFKMELTGFIDNDHGIII